MSLRSGYLVFITSQNAAAPRPLQVGYTASKAGLEGAVGALRMELEGSGVRASIVRPGPALTEMGQDWEPGRIRRLLSTWRHWGLLRHEGYLEADHVALAVMAVLSTPRGAQLDLVQINPEAPLS